MRTQGRALAKHAWTHGRGEHTSSAMISSSKRHQLPMTLPVVQYTVTAVATRLNVLPSKPNVSIRKKKKGKKVAKTTTVHAKEKN